MSMTVSLKSRGRKGDVSLKVKLILLRNDLLVKFTFIQLGLSAG